ncbi:P-loop containing nucleoside triphosphate hydrolase protein [Thamnocephalis sphaerospora]|uniref:P-loop containing nucleoside triphosphate hydrolase protein n=1 Tax=Thamnocephalis sphaerospora TaxID=78915 RepID=A0A4P9XIT6_9FUNG|nr:P-loop containing nucleoside triphosphate hydrolase protein [Thamnocephalis sphaerospora]|eukprot:RKP05627.1 P-loop containing nucleoside triphosphate hydrolase protein [Thamnocephalis sphaerospora]
MEHADSGAALAWIDACYGQRGAMQVLADLFGLALGAAACSPTTNASAALADLPQLVESERSGSILLLGPSGVGKSYVVRELAKHFDAQLFCVDVASLMADHPGAVHVGLRQAVARAATHKRSVLVLDALESLFPCSVDDRDPTSFLATELLHALEDRQQAGLLVIGMASDRSRVDSAVLDAFLDHIELLQPSVAQRRQILERCCKEFVPLEHDELDRISRLSHGYVAADVAALCRVSAERALRSSAMHDAAGRLLVTADDFAASREHIVPSLVQRPGVRQGSDPVRWSDIGGLDSVKQQLVESAVWAYTRADAYKELGIQPPRGVLLYGPPGTGKTLLAKAVATESAANFISVSIPELIKGEVGESEKALKEIFHSAQQSAPCVVFLDELDAIFGSRDASGEVGQQLITQLMLELDALHETNDAKDNGATAASAVILLAATNHPEVIDPAILRSGRLDRLVYVPPPCLADRQHILMLHMNRTPFEDALRAQLLNDECLLEGYTGADIAATVRMAALHALRRAPASHDHCLVSTLIMRAPTVP